MIQLILSSKVSFWFTKGISRQEGGIGIFGFAVLAIFLDRFFGFCSKKRRFFDFGVHCGLRIFRFLAFGFFLGEKYKRVFGFDIRCGFRFFQLDLFGFRFLFDLSGNYAPPLISNSRYNAGYKRKCYREECVTNQLKYRRDPLVANV